MKNQHFCRQTEPDIPTFAKAKFAYAYSSSIRIGVIAKLLWLKGLLALGHATDLAILAKHL